MKRTPGKNSLRISNTLLDISPGFPVLLIAVTVLVLITACKSQSLEKIEISINGSRITAEVAGTDQERAAGLMFRKSMKADHGMLFVYDHDEKLSFWMKNTSIPLSIAFISKDGTIREIADMTPFSVKTIESMHSVRYALEVNQGTFEKLGIQAGDKVEFPPSF